MPVILKKYLTILILAAIVLAAGVFGYRAYQKLMARRAELAVFEARRRAAVRLNAAMQTIYARDQDFDGLSNAEEKQFGTDPAKSDTDSDGLLDGDEVKLYKTEPSKKDTYNLGKPDGWLATRGIILSGGKIDDVKLKLFKAGQIR